MKPVRRVEYPAHAPRCTTFRIMLPMTKPWRTHMAGTFISPIRPFVSVSSNHAARTAHSSSESIA
jgi:hypothetical protein